MRPKIGSGKRTDRYGKSINELRDLALSFSQQAVGMENESGERFQESSAEYFAGHTIDELGYRKIHDLDAEYRKRQYQIVEPYLNVTSNPLGSQNGRIEKVRKELDEKLEEVKATILKPNSKKSEAIAELMEVGRILKSMTRAEGIEITKADIREAQELVVTLDRLAESAKSGAELTPRFEIESFVAKKRAEELILKFYETLKSEPQAPKGRKVKKIDFQEIVFEKPAKKRRK